MKRFAYRRVYIWKKQWFIIWITRLLRCIENQGCSIDSVGIVDLSTEPCLSADDPTSLIGGIDSEANLRDLYDGLCSARKQIA
jgi:hypothetical protein